MYRSKTVTTDQSSDTRYIVCTLVNMSKSRFDHNVTYICQYGTTRNKSSAIIVFEVIAIKPNLIENSRTMTPNYNSILVYMIVQV